MEILFYRVYRLKFFVPDTDGIAASRSTLFRASIAAATITDVAVSIYFDYFVFSGSN